MDCANNKNNDGCDREQKAGFEQNLQELEDIATQLERGQLPLEESLRLYEKGIEAYKNCRKLLENAESRVLKLVRNMEGELEEEALEIPDEQQGEE